MSRVYVRRPETERFWEKVEFTDSCWLWTAALAHGYGRFGVDGSPAMAHRWSYEFCVGPIPEGFTLDHLCRVRRCVNPDHLEPVSHRENILRGVGASAQNAKKETCTQGHDWETDGYVNSRGWRVCRPCRNEWLRAFRHRRSEARRRAVHA